MFFQILSEGYRKVKCEMESQLQFCVLTQETLGQTHGRADSFRADLKKENSFRIFSERGRARKSSSVKRVYYRVNGYTTEPLRLLEADIPGARRETNAIFEIRRKSATIKRDCFGLPSS